MTAASDGSARHRLPGFEALFDAHPDPVYELDRDGYFIRVNEAMAALTGQPMARLLHRSYRPLVHPEDAAHVDEEFRLAWGGQVRSYTMRALEHTDTVITLQVTNIPVVVDGTTSSVWGIARDITHEERARTALLESEHRFRGLFEGAGAGIAIMTLDARFLDANAAYLQMVGYTLAELRGLDLFSILHAEDRTPSARDLGALLRGEVSTHLAERRHLHPAGHIVWARVSASLIRDDTGNPLHVVKTTEDITAAKLAEEGLRRSESLRRVAGQLAKVGGWSLEASDQRVTWTEDLYRLLDAPDGKAPTLADGMSLVVPEDRERLEAALGACLRDGTPFALELEVETYAGRRICLRSMAEAQRGADGSIERVIAASQDITELRAADAETVAAARRLHVAFESMNDSVILIDGGWTITYVSTRTEEMLGLTASRLVGQNLWEVFPEGIGTEVDLVYRRAIATRTPQEVPHFHVPSLDLWVQINAYPTDEGLAVYFRDVTRQRASAEAISRREKKLRRQAEVLDQAQDAITIRDLDHRVTYWNRSAERVSGWSAAHAIGKDVRDLMHPDVASFDDAMGAVLELGSWSGELHQRTRSGAPFIVNSRWTLLTDDAGRPEAVLTINTDVTREKVIEQQLLRTQRMESLGTMASGVAHDLNNVLTPIMMAAGLLQGMETDEARLQLIRTILDSSARAADIVRQILFFARGVDGERVDVDLDALVRDVARIADDSFLKAVHITRTPATLLWPVVGDPTQLHQVVMNLCLNARDAMPDGGTVRLVVDAVIVDDRSAAEHDGATAGRYMCITVEDDGHGMSPAVMDRIFEPFFTTKEFGSGTGLGLSVSAGITRSHGGFITCQSEIGRGTSFHVHLPAAPAAAGAPATPVESIVHRGHDELILVIDDEAQIQAILRHALTSLGYRVLTAAESEEGVALFAGAAEDVAVVLTDMMMPGMDGPATILALREIRPDIPVIAASGLHTEDNIARAEDLGIRHFLYKPWSITTLAHLLRDIIEGDGEPAPNRPAT